MSWFVPMSQTRGIRVALVGASYVGATLVVGAGAIALGVYGPRWTDITGALSLSALAAVSAGFGLVVAGGSRGLAAYRIGLTSARHQVAGVLFAAAAGFIGAATGVFANAHQWFAGSAVGLTIAMLGYALLPTAAGVIAVSALSAALAASTAVEVAAPGPLSVGTALVAVGALLCLVSAVGPVRHRDFGASIGAVVALVGAQSPMAAEDTAGWAYVMSFAVGVACFALYRGLPAVTLLVVGPLGVALAVLEATWEVTSGPFSLVATLAATGVTLMVAGALGTSLRRAQAQRGQRPGTAAGASTTAWRPPVAVSPPRGSRRNEVPRYGGRTDVSGRHDHIAGVPHRDDDRLPDGAWERRVPRQQVSASARGRTERPGSGAPTPPRRPVGMVN